MLNYIYNMILFLGLARYMKEFAVRSLTPYTKYKESSFEDAAVMV